MRNFFFGPSRMTPKYDTVRCVSHCIAILVRLYGGKTNNKPTVPFMDDSWRPFLVVEGLRFRVYHII